MNKKAISLILLVFGFCVAAAKPALAQKPIEVLDPVAVARTRNWGGGFDYYNPWTRLYYEGGIKFKLDLVHKADRNLVKTGKVWIDNDKTYASNEGIVKQHDHRWSNIGLPPGSHEVTVIVKFPGGKKTFHTKVLVRSGKVTPVYLDFDDGDDEDDGNGN